MFCGTEFKLIFNPCENLIYKTFNSQNTKIELLIN